MLRGSVNMTHDVIHVKWLMSLLLTTYCFDALDIALVKKFIYYFILGFN